MARKKPPSKPQKPPQEEPAAGGRMTPPEKGVKVRMYRTGLGDCFLLAFPKEKTARDPRDVFYLLIDCGVFKATENAQKWMREIVQDIKAATQREGSDEGYLDRLVITHEHWDHVSGFHKSQAQDLFASIGLGTLWMAWTESDSIPLANELRNGRRAARHALSHALHRMQGLAAADSETAQLIHKVLDFFGGAPGSDGAMGAADFGAKSALTEEAMDWLKKTYGKGKVQFLRPGEDPLELDGVTDARIYVLGPPEDAALIKRYNPSASGAEVYPKGMAAAVEAAFFAAFGVVPSKVDALPTDDDVAEAKRMCLPFDESYQVKATAARKKKFFKEFYYDADQSPEWRRIEGDWLEAAGEFALQLDSATNNTSLAFALEIGPPGVGQVLLFPGDAQVGNWQSWFGKVKVGKQLLGKEMVWTVGDKKITAEDLLRRTVLYKVGHHGSHNATLRDQGLKLMGRPDGTGALVAMIPVDEVVARTKAGYGEMPLPALVKDLLIRTGGRVMRNDEDAEIIPKGNPTLAGVPGAPQRLEKFGTKHKTDLYIEYTLG
jgi:hypothetical protein